MVVFLSIFFMMYKIVLPTQGKWAHDFISLLFDILMENYLKMGIYKN
jgi:hypothetical protein